MIRHYSGPEELNALGWPPRVIISMNIYGRGMECGANEHYSADSDLTEACEHFFSQIKSRYEGMKIVPKRSELKIKFEGYGNFGVQTEKIDYKEEKIMRPRTEEELEAYQQGYDAGVRDCRVEMSTCYVKVSKLLNTKNKEDDETQTP